METIIAMIKAKHNIGVSINKDEVWITSEGNMDCLKDIESILKNNHCKICTQWFKNQKYTFCIKEVF